MKPIEYHDCAVLELRKCLEDFNELDYGLAVRFRFQVSQSAQQAAHHPGMFRARHRGIRRVNFADGFEEYYLAYVDQPEHILILAVGHAKRRPYYFKNRLKPSGR